MKKLLFAGYCILICSITGLAAPPPVPEIDAGSLSTIVALVGGGLLILRSKSRSK